MKLIKYLIPSGEVGFGLLDGEQISPVGPKEGYNTLAEVLESPEPAQTVKTLIDPAGGTRPLDRVTVLPPIDSQEVWAAGVTYTRSRTARMEESAGAASFYDLVYQAPRPELFFKATPHRVAGPDQPLRIRQDARWNVPEPELALVLNRCLELVGFTVGNDMSSRDIEGENPLYLPPAKVYSQCCGLGPWITLGGFMPNREETTIRMVIERQGQVAFSGATNVGRMARSFEDLIEYLGRDQSFPHGVFLLTGTGVVPADDFTLLAGDSVSISIEGIGTLTNPIVQG